MTPVWGAGIVDEDSGLEMGLPEGCARNEQRRRVRRKGDGWVKMEVMRRRGGEQVVEVVDSNDEAGRRERRGCSAGGSTEWFPDDLAIAMLYDGGVS